MAINLFKYEALVEEFPFIIETIMHRADDNESRKVADCESIQIKRAIRELLLNTPQTSKITGCMVGYDGWGRVDFVLKDGQVIFDAVRASGTFESHYAYTPSEEWDGETVLEAIHREGVSETLTFIVWTEGGREQVGHYSTPEFRAWIYKPSKEFTWGDVIQEAQTKARNEVKAESTF